MVDAAREIQQQHCETARIGPQLPAAQHQQHHAGSQVERIHHETEKLGFAQPAAHQQQDHIWSEGVEHTEQNQHQTSWNQTSRPCQRLQCALGEAKQDVLMDA
jgi:hypothetical protein